ncbi:hypothetical protein MTO96_051777 [Rhipicephalus appendiculatus]
MHTVADIERRFQRKRRSTERNANIKSQLQTLLHALNLDTDRDQDQRPEGGGRCAGGERMHQGPAEPPMSTVPDLDPVHVGDGDNATHPVALNDVLGVIVETQRQFAQALQQNARPLEVHSSGDAASAINTFQGNTQESVKEWLAEIERVASLANWTQSLTMLNAITRLHGAARDWHSFYGIYIQDWGTWKHAVTERFQRKMSLQEFLDYQNERKLLATETIVQYMYAKNAMLEKAPHKLTAEERISLILNGIENDKWATPLASQNCNSVLELIDRAANLDSRRKPVVDLCTDPKYVPMDKTDASRHFSPAYTQKPLAANRLMDIGPRERRCFNCSVYGHISRDCPKPKTDATLKAEQRRNSRQDATFDRSEDRNVHCFLRTTGDALPIVTAHTTGGTELRACIDTGSNVSIVDPKALPPSTEKAACKGHELVTVLDKQIQPEWTTSLSIIVGKLATKIPEVLVLPLPPTMDLLLGSDWRSLANVDVTFHVSNDVTLTSLPTQVATQRVDDAVSPQQPPRREALISTFTTQTPNQAKENITMFVSSKPTTPGPDRELEREISAAHEKVTLDAPSEERKKLYAILATNRDAFATHENQLGTCPLRKIIEPHRDWDRKLPEAVFAINVSWQKSSRYSPFELMHGYIPRVAGQLLLSDVEEDLNEVSRLAELAKKLEQAKENLEQSQRAAKGRYDAKRKEPNFQLGDTVYCTLGSRSSTLDPFYEGPFEVVELLGGNTGIFKIAIATAYVPDGDVMHMDYPQRRGRISKSLSGSERAYFGNFHYVWVSTAVLSYA